MKKPLFKKTSHVIAFALVLTVALGILMYFVTMPLIKNPKLSKTLLRTALHGYIAVTVLEWLWKWLKVKKNIKSPKIVEKILDNSSLLYMVGGYGYLIYMKFC